MSVKPTLGQLQLGFSDFSDLVKFNSVASSLVPLSTDAKGYWCGFEVRDDGLYVVAPGNSDTLTTEELTELTKHPHKDLKKPALSFPFTLNDLNQFLDFYDGIAFVSEKQFLDWLQNKEVDLSEFGLCESGTELKSFANKERFTLLVLIEALLHKLGIDSQSRHATSQLKEMVEQIGASVSDDTIRSHLKRIPDALEGRLK